MLGSTWNEKTSGKLILTLTGLKVTFGTTGFVCAGTVGTGMVPSCPTRNTPNAGLALLALHHAPPAPVLLHAGPARLRVCAKPTPSAGIITLCTVFCRS